ncbi:hypothetical protein EON76_01280 [bacterium]|nr:MAG: hypothetical protein EON76_01280 [bacterium]
MKKITKTRITSAIFWIVFFVLGTYFVVKQPGLKDFSEGRLFGTVITFAALLVFTISVIAVKSYKTSGKYSSILPDLKVALLAFLSYQIFGGSKKKK